MQKQGKDFCSISYILTQQLAIKLFAPLFWQSYTLLYPKTFFSLSRFFVSLAPPPPLSINLLPKPLLLLQAEKSTSLLLFSVASTSLQVSFQTGVRPSVETERNYGFKMHCILTRKKINGDGDVGVFLQLARLCGARVDVDAVYFTHDRP